MYSNKLLAASPKQPIKAETKRKEYKTLLTQQRALTEGEDTMPLIQKGVNPSIGTRSSLEADIFADYLSTIKRGIMGSGLKTATPKRN